MYFGLLLLQFCVEAGGFLAEIKSEKDQNEINATLSSNDSTLSYWIGLSDLAVEGQWVWQHSYSPLGNYTNWGPREPDGGEGEDCVMLEKYGDWIWADLNCELSTTGIHRNLHALCQSPREG